MMDFLFEKVKTEPVLVSTLVESALVVAVAFGFDLTAEQMAALLVLTASILAIFTRSMVAPTENVELLKNELYQDEELG